MRRCSLFGDEEHLDVPISKAMQASTVMQPLFPSLEITGQRCTDGIVTGTGNPRHVIDQGADLVFVLDPFVSLTSDEPGAKARRGNMWIAGQDYKTMSYPRYEQAGNEILRRNSRVSMHTLVPSHSVRCRMSWRKPCKARNFHPIVCDASRSAYRRPLQLATTLRGDLASHGMRLDLEPVAGTIARRDAARTPDGALLLARRGGRRCAA